MPNATKVERVAELKEQIEGANALLLTELPSLTVSEITELRRSHARGRRESLGDQEHPDAARGQRRRPDRARRVSRRPSAVRIHLR
jgi:hypothetical protein